MNHRLFFLFAACLMGIAPLAHAQQTPTFTYADTLVSSGSNLLSPTLALGAPDGNAATFLDRDASLIVDMGPEATGKEDIALFMELLAFGATVRVDFLSEELAVKQSASVAFSIGDQMRTLSYTQAEPYRYVRIVSVEEEIWKLDAIGIQQIPSSVEEPAMLDTVEETLPETPVIPQGLLVKLVDDGDPNTTVDAAVYVIGSDGKRHAFPTQATFTSWFDDFDDIAFIDEKNLASYPLGANVTIRPGTHLVKLTNDPKTYAVEPGGVLRWIRSETLAQSLYGTHWSERVIDLPDVFFGNYTLGQPIDSAMHPDGTLGVDANSKEVRYIENGLWYRIPGSIYSALRFQKDHQVLVRDEIAILYVDGGELVLTGTRQFPY